MTRFHDADRYAGPDEDPTFASAVVLHRYLDTAAQLTMQRDVPVLAGAM